MQVRMALLNINTIMMSLIFFAIITPYVNDYAINVLL